MDNLPLVTVLIPAYNHEKYVNETLLSIINQTYNNIELIILNDGSTDNTGEVISQLGERCNKRFINFEYINRENKGLLNTLKEMESCISGKYFMTFASDDISLPQRIEKQVDILEKNSEYAMCYTSLKYIDHNSVILDKPHKIKHCKTGNVFKNLLYQNFIPAPTVMMRSSVFKELNGYSSDFDFEDYPLWLKIAYKHKIIFLNQKLVHYRLHPNNMSKNLIKTILAVEALLYSWKNETVFPKVIKKFYLNSFYELARSKEDYKDEIVTFKNKALKSWYHPKFIKALYRYNKKYVK